MMRRNKTHGFTLLEVLIALFVFTILSTILMTALHSVIGAISGTETKAERLRNVQMALVTLSRDIEQAVNRSILDSSGGEELSFRGSARSFTLTHMGYANPIGSVARSSMQRSQYFWDEDHLKRATWDALDQAPDSQPHTRSLLEGVSAVHFQYLDQKGRFHNNWPSEGEEMKPLPRAVKITLTLSNWGDISQLYVIPAEPSKTMRNPPSPPS